MVRLYQEKDYEALCQWAVKWKMKPPRPKDLPMLGYTVPGVACGFLIRTDSSVAIFDHFISNPESDAYERDQALDAITSRLLKDSKLLGFSLLKCDTQIKKVKERAERFGFSDIGLFHVLMREI